MTTQSHDITIRDKPRSLCIRRCPACGVWCERPRVHDGDHYGLDYLDELPTRHRFDRNGHSRLPITAACLA